MTAQTGLYDKTLDGWPAGRFVWAGLIVIALAFGGGGYWSMTYTLSGAVIANAELRLESQPKPVSHPVGGQVSAVHVREGETVEAGAALIDLDATARTAELAIVTNELDEVLARRARLIAERDGARAPIFPPALLARARENPGIARLIEDQRRLFDARAEGHRQRLAQLEQRRGQLREGIAGAEARIEGYRRSLALSEKELAGLRQLLERGYATRTRVQELERGKARLEGERGALLAEIAGLRRQIEETRYQALQLAEERREQALSDLRETQARRSELRERQVVAEDALRKITVVAPQGGTVQDLAVHAAGAVIGSGERILTLVPTADRLILEARVDTAERDRIAPGQTAAVRFAAFNQRTTPEIRAGITRISADRVIDEITGQPYYKVVLIAPEEEIARLGTDTHLSAGMPAEVFIETESRSALSFLLKPFTDFLTRAGRGR